MRIENLRPKNTPISEPLIGREGEMKQNYAGGYGFDDGPKGMVYRFVFLGIDNGTYYRTERELSMEVVDALKQVAKEDLPWLMNVVHLARDSAMRQRDPLSAYSLGLAFMDKDDESKRLAYHLFPNIVRTGGDLLGFTSYYRIVGGSFSRGVRNAVRRWYEEHHEKGDLEYQLAKYRQRKNTSQRDVLRLAHPRPKNEDMDYLFGVVTGKREPSHRTPIFKAIEEAKRVDNLEDLLAIVDGAGLSWEMIPTEWHGVPEFWGAFVNRLPKLAFLRHLHRYIGSDYADTALNRLNDLKGIHPGRVLDAYLALRDRGLISGGEDPWLMALRKLFLNGFNEVEKVNAKVAIALDTSGSMFFDSTNRINKAILLAAMLKEAFTDVRLFPFHGRVYDWPANLDLFDAGFMSRFELERWLHSGITDLSRAVSVAARTKPDMIVAITDEQSWEGGHPSVAAGDRKFVVVTLAPGSVSMTDPKNPNQMTVVGWIPEIIELVQSFYAL